MIPEKKNWNNGHDIDIKKARNLIDKKEYSEAQKILKTIIMGKDDSYLALGLLAIAYGKEENYEDSLKYSIKAIQIRFDFPEAHNNIGIALYKKSNYRQAIKSFKTAIKLKPNYSEAFFNLGNVLRAQKKINKAEQAYKNAIKHNSNNAEAYNSLGSLLKDKGELDLAIKNFQSALCIDKDYGDAIINLGSTFLKKGKLDLAAKYFKIAISVEPSQITAYLELARIYYNRQDYHNAKNTCIASFRATKGSSSICEILGNIYRDSGKPNKAIDAYNSALKLSKKTDQGKYLLLIGDLYKNNNNPMEAVNYYERTIYRYPNYSDAYAKLGNFLLDSNKFDASIKMFRKAIKLRPNFPEAYNNMGNALKRNGDIKAAIEKYKKAIFLRVNYPEAYVNLGNAFSALKCVESAISAYEIAIQLNPNLALAHYNLGIQISENGNFDKAIACYKNAISIQPDLHDALHNLGLLKLLKGDYEEGLELYENRFKCSKYHENNSLFFKPDCERWLGESLHPGKHLLIVCEQGLGDIIQFIRYALYLKELGISTSIYAPLKLHPLIKESDIDSSPRLPSEYSGSKDQKWVPLLSIPFHLNVTPKTPLVVDPYIKIRNELVSAWRKNLKLNAKNLTVGINWEGNRSDDTKTARNFSFNYFKKIIDIKGLNLISLQRGEMAQKKISNAMKKNLVPQQDLINKLANSDSGEDFLQYAAVIKNCDLIITTATTLAHLAGSMGIKTWVLVPNIPDWRWGTQEESTFWYPSIRLFRQEDDINWGQTWRRIDCELREFSKQHRAICDEY